MQLFSDAWEEVNRKPEIMRCWLQKLLQLCGCPVFHSLWAFWFSGQLKPPGSVVQPWMDCPTWREKTYQHRVTTFWDLSGPISFEFLASSPSSQCGLWWSSPPHVAWAGGAVANSTFWDLSGSFQRSPVPLPPANWTQSLTSQQIRPTKTIAAQWGKASSQSVVLGALVESYFRVWLFFQSQITNW